MSDELARIHDLEEIQEDFKSHSTPATILDEAGQRLSTGKAHVGEEGVSIHFWPLSPVSLDIQSFARILRLDTGREFPILHSEKCSLCQANGREHYIFRAPKSQE